MPTLFPRFVVALAERQGAERHMKELRGR